jgi:photosystem II stability/assembly factor-like uncharacterized protein
MMEKTRFIRAAIALLCLLAAATQAPPLYAQEGGFTETFDDPDLPGWEFPREAAVTDGVLRLEPGGFAFRHGEWAEPSLALRARRVGEGAIILHYHATDSGDYAVTLGPDFAELHRAGAPLAFEPADIPPDEWLQIEAAFSGGAHHIVVNGATVLMVDDPDPLPPGAVGLHYDGGGYAEFDDLIVTAVGAAAPPPEPGEPPPGPEEGEVEAGEPAAAPPSSSEFTWVRTGGPPGGLGYDIRYNFGDPNIWYVTDNFAGVHISTDGGRTWHPSNSGIPPQAGTSGDAIPIFSLTVDPHNPQIIWVGTNPTGHIYRSTDGGQTWEERDNGVTMEYGGGLTFRGFTIDPRSSDIVYAMAETSDPIIGFAVWGDGTGGAVYRTTDGGETWEVIWDGGIPSSLARYLWVNPENPDILYVSTGIFDRGAVGEGDPATDPFGGLGVLRSTDGGQTWDILNEGNGLENLYLGSLYMHPDDPDILLAAAGHVVPAPYVERVMAEGHSPLGIYRTADGGDTWTQVLEPPPDRLGECFTSVELCPSDPNIAYAGSDQAIYRSDDAGETWEQTTDGSSWGPPGVVAGWPIDMQCDPNDTNRIFANNYNGGNFLSEDGGRTWQNASDGYTGAQMRDVTVDPLYPGRVYAAGRSGVWRSDDGGAHWHGVFYPEGDYDPMPQGLEWQVVAADPGQSGHVLGGHGMILETEDGGESWVVRWTFDDIREELSGDVGGWVIVIAFAPSDSTTVYAGLGSDYCAFGNEPEGSACSPAGAGVLVSHDGGTTWERAVDNNTRDLSIIDLAVDPTDAQTAYIATFQGVFRTNDGGQSWESLYTPTEGFSRVVAVNPSDPQHIVVGIEQIGAYVSTDGGITWEEGIAGLEVNGSLRDIVFDPTNPQVVYASDLLSGMFRSADGGRTWERINNGLRTRAVLGLATSADGQHLYAAADGEGVFRLDVSGAPPESAPEGGTQSAAGGAEPVAEQPSEEEGGGGGFCPSSFAPLAILPFAALIVNRTRKKAAGRQK